MNSENQNTKPTWLEDIQNHSWEPELFISGGISYTLFQLPDILHRKGLLFLERGGFYEPAAMAEILSIAVNGLLVGFILHLVLRGFWTGMVCLSFVFPAGIRREKTADYAPSFRKHLAEVRNTVDFVIFLETACSLVFALSFVFVLVILGVFLFLMIIIPHSGLETQIGETAFLVLQLFSALLFAGGILYGIDFISSGSIKKSRFGRYYYPLWRLYSLLTLSFVYRSPYYTVITNSKKGKVALAGLIYLLLAFGYTGITHPDFGLLYLNTYLSAPDSAVFNPLVYENQRPPGDLIVRMSLPAQETESNVLSVFVPAHKKLEFLAGTDCGEHKISLRFPAENTSRRDCLAALFRFRIDGKIGRPVSPPLWGQHPKTEEFGLFYRLKISNLKEGDHQLTLYYLTENEGENFWGTADFIKI